MRTRLFTISIFIIVLATLSANAYRLSYKDPSGVTRTYDNTSTITDLSSMGEKSMSMSQTVSMTTTESVLSVTSGTATISAKSSNSKMSMSMPDPKNPAETKTMEMPMPDMAISYDRTALGKVSHFKITGAATGTDTDKTMTSNPLEMANTDMEFPDKDLNIGDSWDTTQRMTLPGADQQLTVKNHFTLAGTEVVHGKTYLKIVCQLSAGPSTSSKTVGRGDNVKQLTMTMTMKGTATIFFNEQAGEYHHGEVRVHLDMTIKSDQADGPTITSKMDLTGKTTKI